MASKMKLYCIFDAAAKAYGAPFPAATPGVAERIFKDMVNNSQYKFGKYPEDYSLWYVGEFDEDSAEIVGSKASLAVTAVQVLRSSEVDPSPALDLAKLSQSR